MKKQILALALTLCLCSPSQQAAYAWQGNSLAQEKVLTKKQQTNWLHMWESSPRQMSIMP